MRWDRADEPETPKAAWKRRLASYTLFGAPRFVDEAAIRFVANALFPRLCGRLRWTSRLGLRGSAAYVMASVAFVLVINGPVRLWSLRRREELARLTEQLGHEPTPEELTAHFGWGDQPSSSV
jgi:hypothetical protein